MNKEKSKKSIIDQNLLNKAASRGLSEVYRVRTISEKKDEVRRQYGSEVMKSVIFNFDNPEKEDFLSALESIDSKFPYKDEDYSEYAQ